MITAIIEAQEPEPERQARAAAIAQAVGDDLLLVGQPQFRRVKHRGVVYYEYTWETRRA